jgi:hypothetical protein
MPAKPIKKLPDTVRSYTKYDWERLLDGQIWPLTEGSDFNIKPKHFQILAHKTAKKMGKRVSFLKDKEKTNVYYLQARAATKPVSKKK